MNKATQDNLNLRGKFITFDGIDGSGKTTQIGLVTDYLTKCGLPYHITREPGGTVLSEKIRDLLLDNKADICNETELLLMFAARAQHVHEVIRPKLNAGIWVICSRFTDATVAYQGYARGMNIAHINQLANFVHADLMPDLSLFLDLNIEQSIARVASRGENIDRFEMAGKEFLSKVRQGYLAVAKDNPKRCLVIDATQPITVVADIIEKKISTIM